jgi:hypothetical protein
VASLLPLQRESRFLQNLQKFSAGYGREFGHTATSMELKYSFGTGMPSSLRAATYP